MSKTRVVSPGRLRFSWSMKSFYTTAFLLFMSTLALTLQSNIFYLFSLLPSFTMRPAEHLGALEDLFGEALRCALHRLSDGPIVARQRAADMLKKCQ